MSATRTQVYLSVRQREAIDAVAERDGVTMAEVIRRALDEYLESPAERSTALALTFGAMPDLTVPPRTEWDRRG